MSELIGRFMVSDALAIEGVFDWSMMEDFDIKEIWVEPKYPYGAYMVEAESVHFKDGPGLYYIILRSDEGKEPYVIGADLIEEVNHAIQ